MKKLHVIGTGTPNPIRLAKHSTDLSIWHPIILQCGVDHTLCMCIYPLGRPASWTKQNKTKWRKRYEPKLCSI